MVAGVLIIVLWWLVAHNAGSGWVQLLGDLVFGVLLIGILGPALVVTRARISLRSAPGDGIAGLPRVAAGRLPQPGARPAGRAAWSRHVRRAPPSGGAPSTSSWCWCRRTVACTRSVTFDIASAAPFALQWWTRRVQLSLPSALHVAPRCGGAQTPPLPPRGRDGRLRRAARASKRGCPGAPAPTCPATPAASSTGVRRPTPGT